MSPRNLVLAVLVPILISSMLVSASPAQSLLASPAPAPALAQARDTPPPSFNLRCTPSPDNASEGLYRWFMRCSKDGQNRGFVEWFYRPNPEKVHACDQKKGDGLTTGLSLYFSNEPLGNYQFVKNVVAPYNGCEWAQIDSRWWEKGLFVWLCMTVQKDTGIVHGRECFIFANI